MFSIFSQKGKVHYNVVEYICEYSTDIDLLPKEDFVGSTAFVIEDGTTFILNHNKEWVRKKTVFEENLEKDVENLMQLNYDLTTTNNDLISENILLKAENENIKNQLFML